MRISVVASFCVALFVLSALSVYAGEVSGPFASRLSPADVQQIKAAVAKNMHISHNVKKIEAIRPDKVVVQTRVRTSVEEDTLYDFTVDKRKGAWTINEDSIQVTTETRDFRTNGPAIVR